MPTRFTPRATVASDAAIDNPPSPQRHHDKKVSIGQHLDSTQIEHHDAYMRTTVTIDEEVARMLKDAMHRSRTSFKEALNDALRRGLTASSKPTASKRFVVKGPFLGRMRTGIDPAGFNKLADQLEDEAILAKMRRTDRS